MAEKEKIFAGEQFFYDDLFPSIELDGTAMTKKEFGPFDWQEVRGRLKVVAEIFGDGGTGTGAVTVAILASDEKDGEYTEIVEGSATAGEDEKLAAGKFLEFVATDPDYKYGKVQVTAPATLEGATLKVGLAMT